MYNILLVDDHVLFRQGIKSILEDDYQFKVVGEAGTKWQCISMMKELRPDIILLDYYLPDSNGGETILELKRINSNCKIIVVSMFIDAFCVITALKSGASGYVFKDSSSQILVDAIKEVEENIIYLDPSISINGKNRIINSAFSDKSLDNDSTNILTSRETEILKLIIAGRSLDDIAKLLSISKKTVGVHRYNITKKIGVSTAIELLKYAIHTGLIDSASLKTC